MKRQRGTLQSRNLKTLRYSFSRISSGWSLPMSAKACTRPCRLNRNGIKIGGGLLTHTLHSAAHVVSKNSHTRMPELHDHFYLQARKKLLCRSQSVLDPFRPQLRVSILTEVSQAPEVAVDTGDGSLAARNKRSRDAQTYRTSSRLSLSGVQDWSKTMWFVGPGSYQ